MIFLTVNVIMQLINWNKLSSDIKKTTRKIKDTKKFSLLQLIFIFPADFHLIQSVVKQFRHLHALLKKRVRNTIFYIP